MSRKVVTEKTLELNISAEILQLVRERLPKAYLEGPSLRQEKFKGYDSRLRGVRRGLYLVFQFKSPHRKFPPNRFSINSRQHKILFRRSKMVPIGVWYVLPPYQTLKKVWQMSPNLIYKTYFIRPEDIILPGSNKKYFFLDIYSPARIKGVKEEIKVFDFEEFKKAIEEQIPENGDKLTSKNFLNHEDLRELTKEINESGLNIRGMQILCLNEEYE